MRLFHFREAFVEGFDGGGIQTAICGGGWDIHPAFTVEHAGYELVYEQGCGVVTP